MHRVGFHTRSRNEIYFLPNPHWIKNDSNHVQNHANDPDRILRYKLDDDHIHEKREIHVGFNILSMLRELEELNLVQTVSGAIITPAERASAKYVTDCRFANGEKCYDFWGTDNLFRAKVRVSKKQAEITS